MSDGQDQLQATSPAPPLQPAGQADDWPALATAKLVEVVDTVRTKTTEPALTVARAVVYGLLALLLAGTAVVLVSIMLIRIVDIWVPGDVYWAYLIVGTVFLVIGIVCWALRNRESEPDAD
jgi:hypothetical protein